MRAKLNNNEIKKSKKLIIILLIAFIFLVMIYFAQNFLFIFYRPSFREPVGRTSEDIEFEIIAETLQIPWEIEFLPDGKLIITERTGYLVIISDSDKKRIKIEGVEHIGEGGLLGLALHPEFETNNLIYIYFTTQKERKIINRVERYKFENNELSERKKIIDEIPGNSIHNGGRIAFGPDNLLYITTGDATINSLSQEINSLAGKILRLDDEGNIPEDNPFNNAVYSYGHRNPQGLVWDSQGRLWLTEHGARAFDELNLIEKGKNYGWPIIQGDETMEEMENPIIHSSSDVTWAPAAVVYYNGRIFFGGLRGNALYEYNINLSTFKAHFKAEFGRIRAVKIKQDFLYFSTSNRDGRGKPEPSDDRIIRINLEEFNRV